VSPAATEGPVFEAPWQAQAFALAVHLQAAGAFSAAEWTEALSGELKAAEVADGPNDGRRYYESWLAALEGLVISRGLAGREALAARKAAWAQAFLRTPHGRPVEL
jgi:nitrile hydratase accessory protein